MQRGEGNSKIAMFSEKYLLLKYRVMIKNLLCLDCVQLTFGNVDHVSPVQESLGKFKLSTYVNDFGEFRGIATAFNLSITNINFHSKYIFYSH